MSTHSRSFEYIIATIQKVCMIRWKVPLSFPQKPWHGIPADRESKRRWWPPTRRPCVSCPRSSSRSMRQWHRGSREESSTSPSSWTSHHGHHQPNSWCLHHTSGSACNPELLWWWSRATMAPRCRRAEWIAKCCPWTAQSLRWPPYLLTVCSARMMQWSFPSLRSEQPAWRKTSPWMKSGKSASRKYCSSWSRSCRHCACCEMCKLAASLFNGRDSATCTQTAKFI